MSLQSTLFAAAVLAFSTAATQAATVVKLERVVVTGKAVREVAQLPRVVITGYSEATTLARQTLAAAKSNAKRG